jgi:transcriptional regulator with XRE-family HTH domain
MGIETIGQRIRRLRLSAGFRFQKDFAKAIGIDPASLNQIEQGYRVPKLQNVEKMATALGVSRDLILDGESAARAMPPRPYVAEPVAAPEPQSTTMQHTGRHAHISASDQLSPELQAIIRASVQAEIRDEFRNLAIDIATAIGSSIARRQTTATRKGAGSKAQRV